MSEQTNRLALPYIMPAQALKHLTHNAALQRIDAITQLCIIATRGTPPEAPQEGDCYWTGEDASGSFAGKSGQIAFWQDGAWLYITPKAGWRAWFIDMQLLCYFADDSWQPVPAPKNVSVELLGVGPGVMGDSTNRFSLASNASLFNHGSGGGHQMKINKQTSGATASLLFQSQWAGHAEMGLAGSNDFAIKQSPDGSNWFTAMSISGNGVVYFPNRPMCTATNASGTLQITAAQRFGFSSLSNSRGGFALGNVISGSMREIIVPVTGLYLCQVHYALQSSSAHSCRVSVNSTQIGTEFNLYAASAPQSHNGTMLLSLNHNDRVSLHAGGICEIAFGTGKTELSLVHMG